MPSLTSKLEFRKKKTQQAMLIVFQFYRKGFSDHMKLNQCKHLELPIK